MLEGDTAVYLRGPGQIRRGDNKYICSPADADQLNNLTEDPRELRNLAVSSAHAEMLQSFRDQVASGWDLKRRSRYPLVK
ncbi:hypothetical protein [Zobellella maritima]|uniref:hypothetical protein n=1 Tax=Zobellella maritima TaxID=2059725 RepID=UPI000E3035CD|nr:hypothetical protein [Zobellella maritima]